FGGDGGGWGERRRGWGARPFGGLLGRLLSRLRGRRRRGGRGRGRLRRRRGRGLGGRRRARRGRRARDGGGPDQGDLDAPIPVGQVDGRPTRFRPGDALHGGEEGGLLVHPGRAAGG